MLCRDGPLTILHLCAYSLFSGPLPSTVGLALAQRRKGHKVFLSCDAKRGAFNDFEEAAEPHIAACALAPQPRLTLSAKSTPSELVRDLMRLRRLVRTERVDLVHMHMSHDHVLATLAFLGAARPTRVRTFHSARSLVPRFGQHWLNRQAHGFIVRATQHRDLLRKRFGVNASHVKVIAGGIDSERFRPPTQQERAAARRAYGFSEDALVVGHVALVARRGQEELLAALERLPQSNLHVLFVGRGEAETDLKACVATAHLGDRVHFAGYVPAQELGRVYAAMDAAFVPQVGNDASARAAMEAMACQLPVVAVRTDALSDLVTPELGYPIDSRAPDEIASALAALAGDPERRRRLAEAGHAYVLEQRSFDGEAEQTIAFYRQLAL
jgi:glycosyltransferase involved in cell wall biosynthesis